MASTRLSDYEAQQTIVAASRDLATASQMLLSVIKPVVSTINYQPSQQQVNLCIINVERCSESLVSISSSLIKNGDAIDTAIVNKTAVIGAIRVLRDAMTDSCVSLLNEIEIASDVVKSVLDGLSKSLGNSESIISNGKLAAESVKRTVEAGR